MNPFESIFVGNILVVNSASCNPRILEGTYRAPFQNSTIGQLVTQIWRAENLYVFSE